MEPTLQTAPASNNAMPANTPSYESIARDLSAEVPAPVVPVSKPVAPPVSLPVQKTELQAPHSKKKGSIVKVLAIVAILIVLAVAGLYFWGAKLAQSEQGEFELEEVSFEEIPNI